MQDQAHRADLQITAHGAIMRRKNIPAAATALAAVAITSQFVLDCVEDFGGVL